MGYYADLIKEKQNAKPFYTPGLSTKELKTRAEVERYMFEQRREVDKCISWMESTKKKIQEIEKEPKPHSIGWAERLRQAQSSYKQYKRWMEMHEDFAARAEDWLSKNRNSKDNEKEEKDNADSAYIEASQKAERIINRMLQSRDKKEAKRFLEKIGWETRTLGEDPADYARAIRRAVRNYPEKSAEILSNEKDNSLIGLFDDLRPKDEKTVKEYIRQVKNFIRQCEAKSERSDYAKDYRDLNKRAAESYKKDVEKAERWLSEHRNSDEEKGYYAKLAEEKKQKQNWVISEEELKKFVRNNISRIKQEVKRRTAGKIEDISVFPDDLTAELFERGRTYRFKIVPNEAQGYEIKHLGRV